MWQNHRTLAAALERSEDMQQKGIVTVLGRWDAIGKAQINPAFPVYCNEAGGTTPIAS